jgi:hypothetical protein
MYLKYRDVLAIFMRRLPDTEENKNEVFQRDAELFFKACIELFRPEDEDGSPIGKRNTIEFLNSVELGYGCWLEDIRMAVTAAEDDFPAEYASFYQRFKGASAMAEVYLLNLGWMERKASAEIVKFLKDRS